MSLTIPKYIPEKILVNPAIKYRWDDTNIGPFFDAFDEELASNWADLVEPAIGGLTIAMAEWVIFRLARFDDDPQSLQILEAAWCANIDRHYSEGFELSRRDWLGPIRAPMMVAIDILHATLYESLEGPDKPIEGPCLMSNLVEHVCDVEEEFQLWRNQCIDRLREYYIAPAPLDDLYGKLTEGIIIPKEAFDPEFEFNPDTSIDLARRFLQSIDHTTNSFLCSPQEMLEAGFKGTPYTI